MTKRILAVAALLAVALALLTPRAVADSADDDKQRAAELKKESSAHFRRGAELFEEGLYRAALVELQRAYELMPHYRVLYNIGQTHVALGEFVAAIKAFEALLVQGGDDLERERQAEVRSQIAQLTKRVGTLSVRVEGEAAEITIDGVGAGQAPLEHVPVDVGRRRIVATAPSGATASEEVDIAGGDEKELTLTLIAPTTVEPVASSTEPAPLALTPGMKWGIGLVSGGAGLALSGMVVALMAKSARDDYQDAREQYPGDPDEIESAHDKLSRRSLTADVLFAGGAAVAVAGAVLMLTKGKAKADDRARARRFELGIGPRAVTAMGRF